VRLAATATWRIRPPRPVSDADGAGPLAAGDGQFFEPWGVAVDPAGNIYVADTWNGRIQVFDS
jgi:DNA-binding beta-propeller fold protein YncE